MRGLLFLLAFLVSFELSARVSVKFHPYENSFEKIAEYLGRANQSIDIAMYNMDSSEQNLVIAKIGSQELQNKIRSGRLKVRLLFEGYPGSESHNEKLETFAALGMEIRHLGSKSMHHKFAVIDAKTSHPLLISGSANWSLFSLKNYNENILFFEDEKEIAQAFAHEFESLWSLSDQVMVAQNFGGLTAFFNRGNFVVEDGSLKDHPEISYFSLTKELVSQIDQAKESIDVASTRILLRPVYEALIRAAQRGVKIKILVTMGEYEFKKWREEKTLPDCPEIYEKNCSIGNNYSMFLARKDFLGHENVDVRVKYFSLRRQDYLSKQMHSKYAIFDGKVLMTGSFNWSYSAEYGHIENLILIKGERHKKLIESFLKDFNFLYGQNREDYVSKLTFFEEALKSKKKIYCDFDPISLEVNEIDRFFEISEKMGRSYKEICLERKRF